MGEIADMMLDGTMCQECGEFIGEAVGFRRRCGGCGSEEADDTYPGYTEIIRAFECPIPGCKRKLRTKDGVAQHVRDKHL